MIRLAAAVAVLVVLLEWQQIGCQDFSEGMLYA